jgi:hypothetical protein
LNSQIQEEKSSLDMASMAEDESLKEELEEMRRISSI